MYKSKAPIVATLLSFYTIALLTLAATIGHVAAAGKAVTLTPSALAASTATDVTFHFVATAEYASGNTVSIVAPAGVTMTNTCTTPTVNADNTAPNDGSGSVASQTYTYTFSAGTTTATTTGVDFCIKMTATTANYGITFTDSKTLSTNNDYGGALLYVGSANVVTVTASVSPALAFVIRNSADNATTNTCALGLLTLTATNTCSYRLKITTNSASGYTIQINSDGDLRRSGSGDVADNLDIDRITSGTSVTTGTEGYGIAITAGSNTGGSVTKQSGFTVDDSQLPISSATNLIVGAGTNNPGTTDTTNTVLITHRAAMDGDTNTGNYSQLVTYTVSASF